MSKTMDMTVGNVPKHIVRFAIPLFIVNLFQQLYNTVDTLVVGNFCGNEALAAVSSSGSLIFLLVGLFNGVGAGAGIVISKYYGAKDNDNVSKTIHTDLAFGIISGIILTILGVILTPYILRLMGTPDEVLPMSVIYFRVYFCGAFFNVMYNICTGILQAMGDSKSPLYYLIISSVVNVVLDLLFVAVLDMSVAGAALATIISQFISCILCFRKLIYTDELYKVTISKIGFHKERLREIINIGLPTGLQNSIISVANIVVQSNINAFGKDAMSGCGSYFKIEGFGFLPITCFAMALSTFVGQNVGANRLDRAKEGARFGLITSAVLAEAVGILMIFFAKDLMSMFGGSDEAIEIGVRQIRLECMFYFLLAYSNCISGVLRGAGRAKVPMFTMLICWCIIRISYITIAVKIVPKVDTVFMAYPITWSLSSVVFTIYYIKTGIFKTHDKSRKLQA